MNRRSLPLDRCPPCCLLARPFSTRRAVAPTLQNPNKTLDVAPINLGHPLSRIGTARVIALLNIRDGLRKRGRRAGIRLRSPGGANCLSREPPVTTVAAPARARLGPATPTAKRRGKDPARSLLGRVA